MEELLSSLYIFCSLVRPLLFGFITQGAHDFLEYGALLINLDLSHLPPVTFPPLPPLSLAPGKAHPFPFLLT
jgi:hypothetical protein